MPDLHQRLRSHGLELDRRATPVELSEIEHRVTTARVAESVDSSSTGRHRIAILVASAALVAVAVGLPLVLLDSTDIPNPADMSGMDRALAVADSFLEAWVSHDGDAVLEAFRPDGEVSMFQISSSAGLGRFWTRPGVDERDRLPALHDWYRAVGYESTAEGCAASPRQWSPFGPGSEVWGFACFYEFENDLTRAFHRDPMRGLLLVAVEDGGVSVVSGDDLDGYADLLFEFVRWVEANHPDDAGVMFRDLPHETWYPQLEPASLLAWGSRLDDFAVAFDGPRTLSEPSSLSELGSRARAVCWAADVEFNRTLTELDIAAEGLDYTEAVHRAVVRISEDALAELRHLSPTDGDRVHFENVLAAIEREIDADRALAEATSSDLTGELIDQLTGERVRLTHATAEAGGPDFAQCPVKLGA